MESSIDGARRLNTISEAVAAAQRPTALHESLIKLYTMVPNDGDLVDVINHACTAVSEIEHRRRGVGDGVDVGARAAVGEDATPTLMRAPRPRMAKGVGHALD